MSQILPFLPVILPSMTEGINFRDQRGWRNKGFPSFEENSALVSTVATERLSCANCLKRGLSDGLPLMNTNDPDGNPST
jgi:hypothetical protein